MDDGLSLWRTLSTPLSSGSVSVALTWPCYPSLNSTWPFLGQKIWGLLDGFCLFLLKQCTAKAMWWLVSQSFLTQAFLSVLLAGWCWCLLSRSPAQGPSRALGWSNVAACPARWSRSLLALLLQKSRALLSIYSYNNSISLMEMRCQNAPGFSDLPNVTQKALAGRLPPEIYVPSSNGPFLLLTFRDS